MAKSVDMVARKRLKEETEARIRQQAAMAELSRVSAESRAALPLMESAVGLIARTLGVDCVEILECVSGGLLLRAGVGWEPALIGTITADEPGDSLAAQVLRTCEPVVAVDLNAEHRWAGAGLVARHGLVSGLAVAVPGRGEAFGVLGVYTKKRRAFHQADLEFVCTAAAVVGTAIARCRSQAQAAVLLDVARDVSGVLDLGELLDRAQWRTRMALACDVVATFRWDGEGQTFRPASQTGVPTDVVADLETLAFVPDSWLGRRIAHAGVVVANDMRAQRWLPPELVARLGAAAFIAAPLRVGGSDLGVLVALTTSGVRAFGPAEVELCEGIARLLAMAVQAVELRQGCEEEARVADALVRVGHEVLALRNTRTLLTRLCRLTTDILQCDCSYTLIRDADGGAYLPVASAGLAVAERENLKSARIPRELLAGLLAGLDRGEVVQVVARERPESSKALLTPPGMTVGLFIGLRRGSEIVGMQTAAYRGRWQPFSRDQVRTAHAIARLVSLALDYARMVDELEHVARLKSDFVAAMSHELRTPLHVIMGYSDLLLEGVLGDLTREQVESLQHVGERTRELLDLITATLAVTQLDGGGLPQEVDLAALVGELAEEFGESGRGAAPCPVWNVAPGLPVLRTDRAKLKAVIEHLVDNAVKFTDAAGQVRVEFRECDGGVEVTVGDSGIGIDPELIPSIFEPFRGVERSQESGLGGVGLGLWTVSRLLDMLGGKVTVESTPGIGSTFRVWLPRDSIAPLLSPDQTNAGLI